ncbi:tellurite resistance/C4-dicarboxylate transporter family protein [Kitasatospora sp. NPDC047058]|uniref:tellurite resistance/C4-dicarboxylate transporter family protein n=1 Tax=Kitasatospora sp. NPDC047058 TaxID=3155620 RepID=UPI0033F9143F
MKEHGIPRWATPAPATGGAVMATGIVSVGFRLTGFTVLSAVTLVLAGALWLFLAAGFATLLAVDRRSWLGRAATPPALTAVAATDVLGVRLDLLGWTAVAAALLVLATAAWAVLLPAVLHRLGRRVPGAAFLICVATESLAVLAAVLTPQAGDWLGWAALVLFLLGLALYADALARFDVRQLAVGAGDHWVAGGATAICALAGSKLLASGVWSGAAHSVLRTTTFVLLAVSLGWYLVLLGFEVARPRLRYDLRRWSTVFPLGMTAVAALSTAAAAQVPWLDTLGRVLLWIAAAAWLLTACGAARRLARTTGAARLTGERV